MLLPLLTILPSLPYETVAQGQEQHLCHLCVSHSKDWSMKILTPLALRETRGAKKSCCPQFPTCQMGMKPSCCFLHETARALRQPGQRQGPGREVGYPRGLDKLIPLSLGFPICKQGWPQDSQEARINSIFMIPLECVLLWAPFHK